MSARMGDGKGSCSNAVEEHRESKSLLLVQFPAKYWADSLGSFMLSIAWAGLQTKLHARFRQYQR